MNRLITDKSGFTLVEIIGVILRLTGVSGGIYQFYTSSDAYSRAIEEMNDYQNDASNVIYNLRVGLANASQVYTYNVDTAAFDPDTDLLDKECVYIIPDKEGGFVRYWFEYDEPTSSYVRHSEEFGRTSDDSDYMILAQFNASESGKTVINVVISDKGTGSYKYIEDVNVWLRSGVAGSINGNAIRFKETV